MVRRTLFAAALLLVSASAVPAREGSGRAANADRPYAVMVGDRAPVLKVGKWVKGRPISSFARGRVYVVEFWATWCPPCRKSIPHLSALQQKYRDRATVIGVSVWEPDNQAQVEPFVRQKGDAMAYTVATDAVPKGSKDGADATMVRAWMDASGKSSYGIPMAFVIDRTGRVAWVGEPLDLDAPLEQIVAGRWDLAAETARYRRRMTLWAEEEPVRQRYMEALRAKDYPGALALCDQLLARDPDSYSGLAVTKFRLLLLDLKQPEKAYAFGREAVAGPLSGKRLELASLVEAILDPKTDAGSRDLDLALRAALRADTLAHRKDAEIAALLARVRSARGEK